jgi:hypothetical protein
MPYVPYYGAPGPSSGWENGSPLTNPNATELLAEALDHSEQGLIDVSAAVDEVAPGAPGSRVIDVAKLPAEVVLTDDPRLNPSAPALTMALLVVVESGGVYPDRPEWDGPVAWLGVDEPASGGTTAGGPGMVAGLDVRLIPT